MSLHPALRALAVVAGLPLLVDALFVNALGVGAATHTYQRVNVSVADGGERLAFENEPSSDFEGLALLDCYENSASRLCLLEAARLNDSEGPNVTVRRPPGRGDPADPLESEGTLVRTESGYATVGETLAPAPNRPLRAAWRAVVGLVGFLLVAFGVGSLRPD